jgi:hypothetical protein
MLRNVFTETGLMIRKGIVIGTGVIVEHKPLDNNTFTLYYRDEDGFDRIDIRSFNDRNISTLTDLNRTVNSILSKNDDWLVFWDNY